MVLVSMLILVVAAPSGPLPSTATNEAIFDEIVAGDPTITPSPAPLERLLAATELAEERVRSAADPDAAVDALILIVDGRYALYLRTGEGSHICRIIAAADRVLAGDDAAPRLAAEATFFRQEARDKLGTKRCEEPPAPPAAPAKPAAVAPPGATPAPTLHPEPAPRTPSPRPLRIAGIVSLGFGAAFLGIMTAGVVEHARALDRFDARAAAVPPGQPLDPVTWAAMRDDLDRARFHRNLALGTGISAAVTLGLGVTLLVLTRDRASSRLALAPWWLSSGAGLTASLRLP